MAITKSSGAGARPRAGRKSPLRAATMSGVAAARPGLSTAQILAAGLGQPHEAVLHAGVLPGGGTPQADVLPDGRLLARLPDPVQRAILTWEEFTFTKDRDMLTYATEVMRSIEIFIDKVLNAFAADRPARAGGPLPSWQG